MTDKKAVVAEACLVLTALAKAQAKTSKTLAHLIDDQVFTLRMAFGLIPPPTKPDVPETDFGKKEQT